MAQGRAADGTYGAGVRRTFAMSEREAWTAWAGRAGLARWLGKLRSDLEEGGEGDFEDGTHVTAVRVRPPNQLRVRLTRSGWPAPRTAQLRVVPAASGVTVALHLEGLPDLAERQTTLERWTQVLEASRPSAGASVSRSRPARASAKPRPR